MYKNVKVHIHRPTQELYDSLDIPENGTPDGALKWKEIDNLVVFEPSKDSINRMTIDVDINAYHDKQDVHIKASE